MSDLDTIKILNQCIDTANETINIQKTLIEKKNEAYSKLEVKVLKLEQLCQEKDSVIKSQQEQIKKLEAIERIATKLTKTQKSEIERLETQLYLEKYTDVAKRNIETEAIKEFADRLKNCFCISKEYLDIMGIIDNLVKEMTEVSKK